LKILFFTDLHIPNQTNSISNSDFRECLEFLQFIKEQIVENRVDLVIFGGDLFEDPKSITSSALTFFSDEIATIAQLSQLILLVGNHDSIEHNKIENVQRISLLNHLKHYDRVNVIDAPYWITTIHEEMTQLVFVPYCKNIADILESMAFKLHESHRKILFGHFEISDFNYVNMNKEMILSTVGKLPSVKDIIETYKYDLSFIGHIHEPKTFGPNQEVIYVGSCRNIDFGNSTEDKFIYLIDTQTLSYEKIKNPNTYTFKKFYSLDDIKKYMVEKTKSELSRTRIIFHYRTMDEVQKINKIKSYFDYVKLDKIIDEESSTIDESKESPEFFNRKYEIVNENNILSFIFEFDNIDEKKRDSYIQMFNYIGRQKV